MATMDSDPPKKKKSLFKRTVPRKKPTEPTPEPPEATGVDKSQDEASDLDFFRRSKDVFPMVLEQVLEGDKTPSPEKHERKRRKVSLDPGSPKTPTRASTPATSGPSRERKPSLVLDSDSDSDLVMNIKGKGKEIIKADKIPTPRKSISTPSNGHRPAGRMERDDDFDGYDDYVDKAKGSPGRQPSTRNATTTGPRTRSSRQSSSPVESVDRDKTVIPVDEDSDLEEIAPPKEQEESDDEFSAWVTKAQQRESAQNSDAVVTVLISSHIKGTTPLVVKRKLKQNLQLVLDTWVAHQPRAANFVISPEVASKLILTWKGNKIYGHSTPASLGVQVNERGEMKGASGEGYSRGGLHIKAWIEEDYIQYLEDKDRQQALKLGLVDSEAVFEAEFEEQAPPPSPKKKGIKVTLKAKELDVLNITVHGDTTIATIIEAFRKQRKLGPERGVEIWFDGERLADDTVVGDADIDPDEPNQLEVHVK